MVFERRHRLLGDCVANALAASGVTVERLEPPCLAAELPAVGGHPLIVVDSAVLGDEPIPCLVDELRDGEASILVVATDSADLDWCEMYGHDAVVAPTDDLPTLVTAVHHLLQLADGDRQPVLGSDTHPESDDLRELLASLSPREQSVLEHMMRGLSAVEIATTQYVSVPTVRSHIRSILTKLEVRSQLAAVAVAHEAGWRADGGRIHQI